MRERLGVGARLGVRLGVGAGFKLFSYSVSHHEFKLFQ
jgi:hypothetical protein